MVGEIPGKRQLMKVGGDKTVIHLVLMYWHPPQETLIYTILCWISRLCQISTKNNSFIIITTVATKNQILQHLPAESRCHCYHLLDIVVFASSATNFCRK